MQSSKELHAVVAELLKVPSDVNEVLPDTLPVQGSFPDPDLQHQACAEQLFALYLILTDWETNLESSIQTVINFRTHPHLPSVQINSWKRIMEKHYSLMSFLDSQIEQAGGMPQERFFQYCMRSQTVRDSVSKKITVPFLSFSCEEERKYFLFLGETSHLIIQKYQARMDVFYNIFGRNIEFEILLERIRRLGPDDFSFSEELHESLHEWRIQANLLKAVRALLYGVRMARLHSIEHILVFPPDFMTIRQLERLCERAINVQFIYDLSRYFSYNHNISTTDDNFDGDDDDENDDWTEALDSRSALCDADCCQTPARIWSILTMIKKHADGLESPRSRSSRRHQTIDFGFQSDKREFARYDLLIKELNLGWQLEQYRKPRHCRRRNRLSPCAM